MSDMQKVRVSLTDAEGKVHEVVGYQYAEEPGTVYQNDEMDGDDWSIFLLNRDAVFGVTPIQELPTGLGAVVEVTFDDPEGPVSTQRYVRYDEDCWYDANNDEDAEGSWLSTQKFTVLSEGVK